MQKPISTSLGLIHSRPSETFKIVLYQLQKLVIGHNELGKVLASTMMKLEKKAVLHSGRRL
jgi:hypothetical protein